MNSEHTDKSFTEDTIHQENNEKEIIENDSNDSTQSDHDEADKLKNELGEMKDKYIRLYSEFDNFRRRTSKERLELVGTANEQLMLSLLTIADDIDRSRASMESVTDLNVLKEGIDLIFNKFIKVLESKGLKPMESKGKDFDADVHEALTQMPSPTPELKGKVIDEIEKGYFLNDKMIRVAKVVIGA